MYSLFVRLCSGDSAHSLPAYVFYYIPTATLSHYHPCRWSLDVCLVSSPSACTLSHIIAHSSAPHFESSALFATQQLTIPCRWSPISKHYRTILWFSGGRQSSTHAQRLSQLMEAAMGLDSRGSRRPPMSALHSRYWFGHIDSWIDRDIVREWHRDV